MVNISKWCKWTHKNLFILNYKLYTTYALNASKDISFNSIYVTKLYKGVEDKDKVNIIHMIEFYTKSIQNKSTKNNLFIEMIDTSQNDNLLLKDGSLNIKLIPFGIASHKPSDKIELKKFIYCLLSSLLFLHSISYAHNDIRMPNIIYFHPHYYLIDFEYVRPYSSAYPLPSTKYNVCSFESDLYLLLKMLDLEFPSIIDSDDDLKNIKINISNFLNQPSSVESFCSTNISLIKSVYDD